MTKATIRVDVAAPGAHVRSVLDEHGEVIAMAKAATSRDAFEKARRIVDAFADAERLARAQSLWRTVEEALADPDVSNERIRDDVALLGEVLDPEPK